MLVALQLPLASNLSALAHDCLFFFFFFYAGLRPIRYFQGESAPCIMFFLLED